MANVGELDRLVEGLVGRGLVAPKFVGRQVGQAMINELSNLPSNIAESSATRINQQSQRLADFQNQVIKNLPTPTNSLGINSLGIKSSGGPAKDITKPFVTSRTGGTGFFSGGLNIATPTSEGFNTRNLKADNPLAQFALQNTQGNAPEVNLVQMDAKFKSLLDIRNQLLGSTKNPDQVTGFFG